MHETEASCYIFTLTPKARTALSDRGAVPLALPPTPPPNPAPGRADGDAPPAPPRNRQYRCSRRLRRRASGDGSWRYPQTPRTALKETVLPEAAAQAEAATALGRREYKHTAGEEGEAGGATLGPVAVALAERPAAKAAGAASRAAPAARGVLRDAAPAAGARGERLANAGCGLRSA